MSTVDNQPYGGMPKAEDRKVVVLEPGNRLRVLVGEDGVWLAFTNEDGKGCSIHMDMVGPALATSLVRQELDKWSASAKEAASEFLSWKLDGV
jgi:hypothetical protein